MHTGGKCIRIQYRRSLAFKMSAAARYAMLIGLTNIPEDNDWEVIDRIYSSLVPHIQTKANAKIKRLLQKREPYVIPELIALLSLDEQEFNHLMSCIAQNGMENCRKRNQDNGKVYEATEHWQLE